MKHENNGKCKYCQELFDKFPGFHSGLRYWFENVQLHVPDAHISEAGRGAVDQILYQAMALSKAKFGKSAHNYNAAIDVFRNVKGNIYDKNWYNKSIDPFLEDWIEWYGSPGSKFWELPHFEVKDWKALVKQGLLKIVEER